mmetsp:Transcript_32744/g.74793  ORF Transcript_32744/g.74793 Transcript_32744/m.74793 type:complete len:109 (-) Transcript_32744:88-414(-)
MSVNFGSLLLASFGSSKASETVGSAECTLGVPLHHLSQTLGRFSVDACACFFRLFGPRASETVGAGCTLGVPLSVRGVTARTAAERNPCIVCQWHHGGPEVAPGRVRV